MCNLQLGAVEHGPALEMLLAGACLIRRARLGLFARLACMHHPFPLSLLLVLLLLSFSARPPRACLEISGRFRRNGNSTTLKKRQRNTKSVEFEPCTREIGQLPFSEGLSHLAALGQCCVAEWLLRFSLFPGVGRTLLSGHGQFGNSALAHFLPANFTLPFFFFASHTTI